MKKSFYFVFILIILTNSSFSSTRGDVQIMEARENIQYLGQKITTDYFSLYKQPTNILLKNEFLKTIKELEGNIEKIKHSTQNTTTQYILGYYRDSVTYIKSLSIKSPIKDKDSVLLLQASDAFLEGARVIEEEHKYESTKEENMLVRYKEILYLIESTSKYYMAFQVGLKSKTIISLENQPDKTIESEMKKNILKIHDELQDISKYHYNKELRQQLAIINNIWEHNKKFLINTKMKLPHLVLLSNEYIKELLINLEQYHKQNL